MGNFPFHALVIPFLPAFLCLKERARPKMDRFLQNIQFISAIILHFLIFFLISAFCLPFAYLKLILHSLISVIRYRGGSNCHRFGMLWLYIFVGPIILTARFFADFGFMLYDDF